MVLEDVTELYVPVRCRYSCYVKTTDLAPAITLELK